MTDPFDVHKTLKVALEILDYLEADVGFGESITYSEWECYDKSIDIKKIHRLLRRELSQQKPKENAINCAYWKCNNRESACYGVCPESKDFASKKFHAQKVLKMFGIKNPK
jgi:hypothetical protein